MSYNFLISARKIRSLRGNTYSDYKEHNFSQFVLNDYTCDNGLGGRYKWYWSWRQLIAAGTVKVSRAIPVAGGIDPR